MVGKPASTFCGSFGQNSCTCLVPNHNIHLAALIILSHIFTHPGSQHEHHGLTKNATPCDTYSSYSWLDRSKLFLIFAFGPSPSVAKGSRPFGTLSGFLGSSWWYRTHCSVGTMCCRRRSCVRPKTSHRCAWLIRHLPPWPVQGDLTNLERNRHRTRPGLSMHLRRRDMAQASHL